jgi:hypothetical protein
LKLLSSDAPEDTYTFTIYVFSSATSSTDGSQAATTFSFDLDVISNDIDVPECSSDDPYSCFGFDSYCESGTCDTRDCKISDCNKVLNPVSTF